jgi:hypothetical protein
MYGKGKRKIPIGWGAILVVIAALIDLIGFLLDWVTFGVGGFLMDAIAAIVLTLCLLPFGVFLFAPRNALGTLITAAISATPLDIFCPWAIRVTMLIITQRHPVEEEGNEGQS